VSLSSHPLEHLLERLLLADERLLLACERLLLALGGAIDPLHGARGPLEQVPVRVLVHAPMIA